MFYTVSNPLPRSIRTAFSLGGTGNPNNVTDSGQVGVEIVGQVAVVVLPPRISVADAPVIAEMIQTSAAESTSVLVDLTPVLIMDAATARVLRSEQRRCGYAGVRFAVAGADGQPLKVLEILGLAKDLGAYLTRAEALEASRRTTIAPKSVELQVHDLLEQADRADLPAGRREALKRTAIELALPIARTMARRYRQRGEPIEDLEQVASLGLVQAVLGYRPDRGSGFLAYAVPTILGELRRHFRDRTWSVRPPRALQELQSSVVSAWPELAQSLGHVPGDVEIASHLGMDHATVREAMRSGSGHYAVSLDAKVGIGSERTLLDVFGQEDDELESVELRIVVRPIIAALPARDREVLHLRMTTELTQAEIGQRVGLSQMGVSRTLTSALAALRTAIDDGRSAQPTPERRRRRPAETAGA
ncbi:MAG TPA: sigma-70 family RNA polymerase sigma factor [Micromonosporaceae bacterium]|jgi:RNA polymerase sigma-B factor